MAGAISDGTTNLTNLVVESLGPASGGGGVSTTSVGQILTSTFSSRNSALVGELWTSGASVGWPGVASIISTSRLSSSVTVVANEVWASGISAGWPGVASIVSTSRLSSSVTVVTNALWASGLSLGNATAGGTAITAISSTSSLVGIWVVQPSASSFTRITWAAAQPGDIILTSIFPDAAQSSISSGLMFHSHCTIAGFIELRLSNVSTLVQNQTSKSFIFTRITPF